MPDRRWSPDLFVAVFNDKHVGADSIDWLQRVGQLAEHRSLLIRRHSPAKWAEVFDGVLTDLGWPGGRSLSSVEYQLVNR